MDPDAAAEARREYIIGRCRLPAAAMFGDHQALLHAAIGVAPAPGAGGAAGEPPPHMNPVQQALNQGFEHVIADLPELQQDEGELQAMEGLEEAPLELDPDAEDGAPRCALRVPSQREEQPYP